MIMRFLNYDNEATGKIAEEIKVESGKFIKSKVFLFSRLGNWRRGVLFQAIK